ncbi:DUF2213 domain-containing protein [Providencia stuartii]
MKLSSIHVKSLAVNSSNISNETIDGDEHIVIRGVVPVVDDVVMNGGLYPASEINKSFKSIEGRQCPYGHPKIGSDYVSADMPRAVNQYHIGAWAENVRKDGEKVVMDVKVNRRFADGSEKGKEFLSRIDDIIAGNNSEPIHVSTGLLLQREQNKGKSKGKTYTWVARNMHFDHVAILPASEPGAATPEDGVGMFVNSEGERLGVEEVNLLEVDPINPSEESIVNKVITKLSTLFSVNNKEVIDPMKEIITNALKAKGIETEGKSDAELLDAYNQMNAEEKKGEAPEEKSERDKKEKEKDAATNADAITAAVNAAIKPLTDKIDALEGQLNANADKEINAMRDAVKAKFGMSDTAVNALSGDPLKELYAKCNVSHGLNGSFQQVNSSQSVSDMPE